MVKPLEEIRAPFPSFEEFTALRPFPFGFTTVNPYGIWYFYVFKS